MDFIEWLPVSEGFDTILVVVDRLTKMAHFIPTRSDIDAPQLAKIFLQNIFTKHGTPADIVSDRGKHFVSRFWASLCTLLGVRSNLSTAYHPETDGQTERTNQILEQYLRIYVNYEQNDWINLLPLAEFAYNNTTQSATGMSPFFANLGFHPRIEVGVEQVSSAEASLMARDLDSLHKHLKEQFRITLTAYEAATDHRRLPAPPFNVGTSVWLDARNIRTTRPAKKLDHKRLGPFTVTKVVSTHACRLGLPHTLRSIHNVFHVSLLEPAVTDAYPGQQPDLPPPIIIDDEQQWEVSAVVDSKSDRRVRGGVLYLVAWKGFEDSAEPITWEPYDNLTNALLALHDFHTRFPTKPRSTLYRG